MRRCAATSEISRPAWTRARRSSSPTGSGRELIPRRSEEHTSELQSLMRISYAVFCLKKKKTHTQNQLSISIDNNNINDKTYNTKRLTPLKERTDIHQQYLKTLEHSTHYSTSD